jgi:Flp pilus assembly pilin Flp
MVWSSNGKPGQIRRRRSMRVITPRTQFERFAIDDRGATAIEYALIASILGIALLPVLSNTSSGVASLYTRVQDYFVIVNGG